MLFSQRYHQALSAGRLSVVIPDDARPKLATNLAQFDISIGVRRDPNDNWVSNSSASEEAVLQLVMEHGWEDVPYSNTQESVNFYNVFQELIRHSKEPIVFDLIELFLSFLESDQREKCRVKINGIFDRNDCAWRIADGEFFKLDADFMGERLAANAHDSLAANSFVGAADEYAKARQELGAGDVKDAIIHAGKSFESVMKVMTGLDHASADHLVKAMLSQKYFDDLPENIRAGFAEQVMKTLPFLRNKLAGHGQGAEIIEVPLVYGELAIQLAAAFHNFLISKHLERRPPEPPKPDAKSSIDDDIPF